MTVSYACQSKVLLQGRCAHAVPLPSSSCASCLFQELADLPVGMLVICTLQHVADTSYTPVACKLQAHLVCPAMQSAAFQAMSDHLQTL